jgi:hypothetical protein
LTLGQGRAVLHSSGPGGKRELVAAGASAIAVARGEGRLLVAADREVLFFTLSGERVARFGADLGVTSLALSARWLVLGYVDGNVELISRRSGRRRERFSFGEVPASPVERLLVGPMETLVAGYANGLLGIWNLESGQRLHHARLHGPVVHLLLSGARLHAATELGSHLTWDLGVLSRPYCPLMRDVWGRVPVVWEEGRAVFQKPPAGHRCNPR